MFKDKLLTKVIEAYNGKHVLNRILKHGAEALELGGQVRDMTIYFQEIIGLTDITECLSPEDLVHFVNEYLTIMTNTIESHEGIVDRYIGIGGIMAFWGANDETDHADKACVCAADIVARRRLLSEHWNHKEIFSLRVSIGINSGRVILGNFGTAFRFQYTVLGDNVNLASQLESANKQYGTEILFSEFTNQRLNAKMKAREVDSIHLRGKSEPVKLFTLEA
jgi:adenylate cyclase